MGQVGAVGQAGPDLQPVAQAEPGLVDVEQAVVGVGPGPQVPPPQPLGVHGSEGVAPQPGAGDEVGDEQVQAAVDQHLAQVDREAQRLRRPQPATDARPTQRPAQVAAQQAEHGERHAVAPGRLQHPPGLGVGRHHHAVVGQRHAAPPRTPSPSRSGSQFFGRPHHRRGGHHPPEQPVGRRRAAAAVSGTGAMSPSWRSRSMSCFMLRTKSPPEMSSSAITSSSSSPDAHP